ncbi:MAG: dihydroneopterin aldolase [Pseudomonadota bacterium]
MDAQNEARLAFAHPLERSYAAGRPEFDRISVRDMVLTADIGAFQSERGSKQRLRFNVVVEVAPTDAIQGDDVDGILSYDRITEAIEGALAEERLNLLETLAERVADRILADAMAERCYIRVEKLDRGPGDLGIEIMRSQGRLPDIEDDTPRPRIVLLAAEAIDAAHLRSWIDQIAGAPAIICVGPGRRPGPEVDHPMVQRRIDLLALEQNAWALASRDARCVVVGSKTELLWGLRHGQLSVWAPSKMVLDALESPTKAHQDGAVLAIWLAEQMDATEIVSLGVPLQDHSAVPARALTTTDLHLGLDQGAPRS